MDYPTAGACLLFLCISLWCYRRGLKDGLAIQRGGQPEPIKTPVKMVQEYKAAKLDEVATKEAKAEGDRMIQGLANLLSYTGKPQNPKEGE